MTAPLVVGAGVAVFGWLPGLVRDRVAARLVDRSGLPVKVGEVSLGLLSTTVQEVVLGGDSLGLKVMAKEIAVDAGPLSLALRGIAGIEAVNVGSLTVRLRLHQPASQKALTRLLAGPGSTAKASLGSSAGMALGVKRLDVALGDERGDLLRATGELRMERGSATLEVDRLQLGAEGEGELALRNVSIGLSRGASGWQLARAQVRSAQCWLKDATKKEASSTWQRMLAAHDVLDALRASGAPVVKDRETKSAPLPRIADGATLALDALSVHAQRGAEAILGAVHAKAALRADRSLSLTGSGKAQGGGSLAYDLVLRPAQLQADGRLNIRSLPLSLVAPFLPAIPWHEPEHGRVDAELVVKTEPAQAVTFSGEIALRDAALLSARFAPSVVADLNVTLLGEGRFLPARHRLEIAKSQLRLSGATVDLRGAMEWSDAHYLFDLDARLPPTPCTQAVRSIPESLLGDLALATWQGKLSGSLRVLADSRALHDLVLEIKPEDRCQFVTVPAMADLRRFHDVFVHSVEEPDGTMFEMETGPGTPAWAYLEDISPFLVHAVLAHEDAGFFQHKGFSPRHIRDALARNLQEGRYVVGASTITMQLVKNIFLHREKTLGRKIQEVLLTWWIERVMEKRDILELYLNVIEYGPGVYGIRNGARHYFNRMPAQLSPAEAVYLATILPNPKRYHAAFERGAISPQWSEIMRKLLVRLGERGSYSPEAVAYGLQELSPFHFVPEGKVVAPRQMMGDAAPLPYQRSFTDGPEWEGENGQTAPLPP